MQRNTSRKDAFRRFVFRWGPVIVVSALIFLSSSLPYFGITSDDSETGNLINILFRKTGHVTGYALLALGYLRGIQKFDRRTVLLTLLICLLYASSDEFHQLFVASRSSKPTDVLIDLGGSIIGCLACWRWMGLRRVVYEFFLPV